MKWADMQNLVEDFLQYLRHERGQSEHTQETYAALLGRFVKWAERQGLADWQSVEFFHLMNFLQHERERTTAHQPGDARTKLSGESVYLQIAALRAFYRFCENERLLPANAAENLSLPRRWKRLPKALSDAEIRGLLAPVHPETPESLCDQARETPLVALSLRREANRERLHRPARVPDGHRGDEA